MKRLAILSAVALLAACGGGGGGDGGKGGPEGAPKGAGGPPPIPPYQMREELPGGNRLAASTSQGEALFSNRCGTCHLAGGMGTNLLTGQRIAAGKPPETALLTNRDDLTADYIKSVVRGGKVAMPRISRVEVTDAELDAIAAYLAKGDK